MTPPNQPSEFQHYFERRRSQDRNRRMLNNLPLAHRLAADRASADPAESQYLLGQAMVGLVEAAASFEQCDAGVRFGAYARPRIADALLRTRDETEVQAAQAQIAEAISTQDRVQELASFLAVPVDALVGGLMDAAARERVLDRQGSLRGVA